MPETVIGPYQVLGPLGAGGMGEVYKALDPRVGRQVALKLLPESMAKDPDLRRRFEQEARLAAALNHPNVMAIYDVGLDRHPPYIVAELVRGEWLRTMIAGGPMPPRKAVDIAAQIAAGLAAAHTAGIVHRDLKPENVIVTSEGIAKILDFGVARMEVKAAKANETVTMAHTSSGSVVGTAAYMSPEQARAGDVDYRSDQFSLGLVLYEMLSGKQAFTGPSAVQVMSAIIEQEPPPIERNLPTQLRWILQRCLAKEREGRYESTRDLARELAQLRDHFSELTAIAGGVQPAIAPTKRRKLPWIAAAACVLVGVAGWCAAQLSRNPHAVDLSRYRTTPFATALVTQGAPAWSRDGKSIAFVGDDGGASQLYVQGVDSPTAVAISRGPWQVYSGYPPFWSPDSQSIYFRCGKDDQGGLCRIPAGGGESIMVQPNALSGSISQDGKTLAMLVFPNKDYFRLEMMTASPPDAPPRKYEPQPFPAGTHYNQPVVAFAPDGKSIFVAIAFEGKGETTWLLPWPAGPARQVLPGGLPFSNTPQISWEPDSRHLVFAVETDASHHYQLYMADTRNGGYWPVFMEDRPASSPSVSPDGARMVYRSNLSHADVVAVPIGDGPVRTLLGSSRTEQMADASQAGPQLVYVTDRRGTQEIWLTSTAEGWDRPLMTTESFRVDGHPASTFLDPALSPDGRRVAFSAGVGGNFHIYTAFASGGTPVRVTKVPGLEDEPAWSPDGNWIAFGHLVGHGFLLAKVRPGSGEAPIELGTVGGNAVPAWSPTGEWIAMHDDRGRLTLFSPDGKAKRTLPGDSGPCAWSRDGKTLYQVTVDNPTLVAIDTATGKQRKLRDLPGLEPFSDSNPGWRASLTSDGKSIVYTVNRRRTEIWILDGVQTPQAWWRRILGK